MVLSEQRLENEGTVEQEGLSVLKPYYAVTIIATVIDTKEHRQCTYIWMKRYGIVCVCGWFWIVELTLVKYIGIPTPMYV